MLRSNSKSLGKHEVSLEEKRKAAVGRAEKEGFKWAACCRWIRPKWCSHNYRSIFQQQAAKSYQAVCLTHFLSTGISGTNISTFLRHGEIFKITLLQFSRRICHSVSKNFLNRLRFDGVTAMSLLFACSDKLCCYKYVLSVCFNFCIFLTINVIAEIIFW